MNEEEYSDLLTAIRGERFPVALSALRHVASDRGWLECLRYYGHLVLDESLESEALAELEGGVNEWVRKAHTIRSATVGAP